MERAQKIPQYRKVYETLRKHIIEGVYKEGDLLPSENELCVINGVTRPTVRKALDALLNEGFIKRQQGKGSIVKGIPHGVGILSIGGTTSAVGEGKLKTKIIVGPEIRKWDDALTFPISETEKELGCVYLERLRYLNDKPVFFDITKMPNVHLPRITQKNFDDKSLFEMLRIHYGIQVMGGEQKISAVAANEQLQEYFGVEPGHPVLQLSRKIETNKIDFFIYSQVVCNTEEQALYGSF